MFPGMSPREMQKAMKRLGIKQEEIEAYEVVIKCEGINIVVKNPQVARVNMMGHETFQVSGEIEEVSSTDNGKTEINEEDIETVIAQADCTREQAAEALNKFNGNIAEAILHIKNPA